MNNEIWRDIIGFEGYYQVSNLGRVRRTKTERLLKGSLDEEGYRSVGLTINHKQKWFRVHRLVCAAFHDNPENKPQVNHINGIKYDNRAENLEWCTALENSIHAYRTGLRDNVVQKLREANTGKHHSEETKQKIGEAGRGRKHSEETKQKISESLKGKASDAKGTIWINNGIESRMIKPDKIQAYLDNGYVLGRLKSA